MMKEVLANLVSLQEYDSRLDHLKMQKGDLPVVIEDLDHSLQNKQTRATELGSQIEKLQADRRIFEREAEASKAQLKKYQDQLYTVQNNKEYDALGTEIDTKKLELENLENKILQTIDDEESLKNEIESLNGAVSDIDSQLKENRLELEEIDQQTRTEEDQIRSKRDEIAGKIEERYIRSYERIRKAKSGLAIAPVERNSCGGCFSAIPPQKIAEIREAKRIHNCEYCGRILVWTEKSES
ncbi:MAG TPA: C4-type zinc ribbon domain-containing protein [Calditrichia bacterium]|nr:hypothetical protein [Calditrichota bacterium]HQU70767.1 C4-type zinc ribbon domain-containing protein [Calditrichia bacterium]HQV30333.1 C4-type zinc ribbon domain-containing protein [Calditrichia bacterium]